MANYYYSGQGTLYVGTRDGNGRPQGLVSVGNVPTLEISIDIEKLEHKESTTGNRAVDLTLIQEQNATFNMVLESFSTENLALAFFGSQATVTGAAVVGEAVTLYAPDANGDPVKTPLAHINLDSSVAPALVDSLAASMTLNTDYAIDYANGSIWALSGWTGATLPDTGSIGYTHLGYPQLNAFTSTTVERFLRFEGINTVNQDAVVVDIFKASFDPAQAWPLINDEVGQLTVTGNILQDSLNGGTGSEFFIERKSIAQP